MNHEPSYGVKFGGALPKAGARATVDVARIGAKDEVVAVARAANRVDGCFKARRFRPDDASADREDTVPSEATLRELEAARAQRIEEMPVWLVVLEVSFPDDDPDVRAQFTFHGIRAPNEKAAGARAALQLGQQLARGDALVENVVAGQTRSEESQPKLFGGTRERVDPATGEITTEPERPSSPVLEIGLGGAKDTEEPRTTRSRRRSHVVAQGGAA